MTYECPACHRMTLDYAKCTPRVPITGYCACCCQPLTYKVTKTFINGLLCGLTIVETTTVVYPVGFRCEKPCAGSGYVITAVEQV